MQDIAHVLEDNNYTVFLPQRDGFEFANLNRFFLKRGYSLQHTTIILNRAIFCLDVFHVLDSDGLVLNMNGRVPDEGAMVEAGIAWTAGKKIVIYKNDSRSLINGNDNPLLLGLADFKIITDIHAVVGIFDNYFTSGPGQNSLPKINDLNAKTLYNQGKKIALLADQRMQADDLCRQLIKTLGEGNEYTFE